jgi:two-component sensor histidine kinase
MVLNSRHPMFIAWGPELGFLYNDGYAPILGRRHPAALGRRFEAIWSDIWTEIRPLVDRALAGEATWAEDLKLIMERNGYPEETYFTFSYSPVRDETGGIAGMLCACTETTDKVIAQRQLQGAAQALRESEQALLGERDRLYALFEKAPGFVAALHGPDHVFALANQAYRQLIGHRDVLGRTAREALPEVEGQGLFELLDRVYATGEPFIGRELRVVLQRTPGATPEERYVDFIYQPIRERDGHVSGIFCEGSDVTERALYMARQRLLLDELNHRVKNNLATVQSIAFQTARHAPDVESFRKTFEARLVALSHTHDVLTRRAWESAEVREILEMELSPYGQSRITLQGPTVLLNARQALALGMIVHELATNAAKYGALSASGGHLVVTWSLVRGEEGDCIVTLGWTETGGPPVSVPTRPGFGSRLIRSSVAGALRGELQMDYRPEGLACEIRAVVEDEAESPLAP